MKRPLSHSSLKSPLQSNNPLVFLGHILLVAGVIAGGIALFFQYYLPTTTHHGETLTVPDLRGFSFEEAQDFLSHPDLQLTVGDSDFVASEAPGIVLSQKPSPMEQVKIGRRIYLTLNKYEAPTAKIPNILDVSLKNAIRQLTSFQLRVGSVTYLPHPQADRVLRISVGGEELTPKQIKQGYIVAQSTAIDLGVGDGMGEIAVTMPKLVGRPADEAEIYALGIGLHVSQLHWVKGSGKPMGVVVRQKPYYGTKMRKGQGIELWVAAGWESN